MGRCARINNLDIYHKKMDGDNVQENAVVLCKKCYEKSRYNKDSVSSPPPFSLLTKIYAKILDEYRCECRSEKGCHWNQVINDKVTKQKMTIIWYKLQISV